MPKIILENITKRWGKFYGVDNLSLVIEDNSFITLLGPSGCGKTTILRMIAGLETPTSGRISIGDRVVFDSEAGINVPANKRNVGFLFQNYALWPNMTVYQNISFGLSNVKKEMPIYDFEAMNISEEINALRNPKRLSELINESRDKNGKIDEEKVYLKIIDTYTVSMFTAKKIYGFGIHTADSPEKKAAEITAELREKLDGIIRAHEAKNERLDDSFAVSADGKIKTEIRKLTKEEIDKAVRRVSAIVKIGMFMNRYPAELSGGQQQRVAIARTLAPEPSVLFMDEPLSNLDAKLRLEMRYELQRLHVETGSTFVYVTHDQMEAMTLATKICLVNNGVLQQYDAPLDVYNKPINTFAADFVGSPSINFVEANGVQKDDGSFEFKIFEELPVTFIPNDKINCDSWREKTAEEMLRHSSEVVEKSNKDEHFRYHIAKVEEEDYSIEDEPEITDRDYVIGIRPEFIEVSENKGMKAVVYGAMPTGMESTLKFRVGDYLLTGVVFGGITYKLGTEVNIDIAGKNILLFDRRTGKIICSGRLQLK